jgi:hypothetical protein
VIAVLQGVSVGLFLLVLAAGFFGTQDTLENFAPTFVWIIWWVGMAYAAALAGNLWPTINPWSILFAGFEKVVHLLGARGRLGPELTYPSWLGVWPAVALFGFFAWFELIVETAKVPGTLATAILIYSGITWLGMAAFGREVWLARGEAFSLAFGVLGRFAPIDHPWRDARRRQWGRVAPHQNVTFDIEVPLLTPVEHRLGLTVVANVGLRAGDLPLGFALEHREVEVPRCELRVPLQVFLRLELT